MPDTDGCYVVPAFTGLGAPWWRSDARGVIAGITRGTDKARLVRAACESMAYQTYDILKAMEADSGHALTSLEVDGGAANNPFIMQFQADLLGIDVVRGQTSESTALGAAFLAGLASGFWADRDELAGLFEDETRFSPEMAEERHAVRECWTCQVSVRPSLRPPHRALLIRTSCPQFLAAWYASSSMSARTARGARR